MGGYLYKLYKPYIKLTRTYIKPIYLLDFATLCFFLRATGALAPVARLSSSVENKKVYALPKICKAFATGECRLGDLCRHVHAETPVQNSKKVDLMRCSSCSTSTEGGDEHNTQQHEQDVKQQPQKKHSSYAQKLIVVKQILFC